MANIISVINNKGGTGKTTTVLNLGAALAKRKQRVLLVDLDSQGNLTSTFQSGTNDMGIGELLVGNCSMDDVLKTNGNLSLIPSTDKLLDFEFQINNEPGREYMLREQLEKLADDFDFILIDCPPSLGTLSINSLVAANSFIVPMQAENFAFIGLDRIMLITEKVKKRMNPSLELDGILFVKLAPRTKFSQAVISNLTNNQNFQGKLFNTYIRQDIALMESGAFKQTIFEYAPRSRGSHDYMDLAKEILKRYGKK
ncbi:MAG: ParA family protein [Tenuifilaceae bacterium]|jgi:chromosome partitioning protein|nr:ParA family protein [Bacteroidales bacterium]MDI9515793.1 ParA family protein [Bacteroidota bacterium]NLH57415.1 ParA family protein [Rikenellaceae bacterium]OQC62195.1 MAG: Sporulation initiation inhibitor protein Soj [Bacteroidetes bacterium ADurb.Bin008]HNV81073.1 ParA family protein [Tenuifilaceae bacterium]